MSIYIIYIYTYIYIYIHSDLSNCQCCLPWRQLRGKSRVNLPQMLPPEDRI